MPFEWDRLLFHCPIRHPGQESVGTKVSLPTAQRVDPLDRDTFVPFSGLPASQTRSPSTGHTQDGQATSPDTFVPQTLPDRDTFVPLGVSTGQI